MTAEGQLTQANDQQSVPMMSTCTLPAIKQGHYQHFMHYLLQAVGTKEGGF